MPTKSCPVCGHPIHKVRPHAQKAYCGFCGKDREFERVACPVRHYRDNKVLTDRREVVDGRSVPVLEDCRTCMGTGMVWISDD